MRRNQSLYLGILCLVGGALLSGCATLPDDSTNAKSVHFEGLNRVRYIEIFVWGGDAITGDMRANVYNTSLVRDVDYRATKDSAPQAYVESVNLDQVKGQFSALAASMNGPKLWMLDWVDVPLGTDRVLNGKTIPWCAELHATRDELKTMGKVGYAPTTIERKSKIGYNKGTLVFLIDDASGTTWIMKGMEIGVKPQYTTRSSLLRFWAGSSSFRRDGRFAPGCSIRT